MLHEWIAKVSDRLYGPEGLEEKFVGLSQEKIENTLDRQKQAKLQLILNTIELNRRLYKILSARLN